MDKINFYAITLMLMWTSCVMYISTEYNCFFSFPQTQSGHLATAIPHSIPPAVKPRKVENPFHFSKLSLSIYKYYSVF